MIARPHKIGANCPRIVSTSGNSGTPSTVTNPRRRRRHPRTEPTEPDGYAVVVGGYTVVVVTRLRLLGPRP